MQDFLLEQIKTISNLCQIAIILRLSGQDKLLPTIFEFLHGETQAIIDDYCVVKDD